MDIVQSWILNRDNAYAHDCEELSQINLMGKLGAKTNEVVIEHNKLNKKVDDNENDIEDKIQDTNKKKVSHSDMLEIYKNDKGNHMGSWQGVKSPVYSEPGIQGQVIKNIEDIKNINSELNNISYNVKNYGAKGDGVNDDTLSIQEAIGSDFTKYHTNAPLRKVVFERGKTYCISSTIKVPPYTDIDFNGATIKAIKGGSFINNYMMCVNSEDCINWSFGYYPRVGEITGGWFDGNDLPLVKGIFLCSNHRVTKMKMWKLYNSIYSPNVYIDNYFLEDIKINYPMGVDYQIFKSGQGDGIHISKIHSPSDIEELEYGGGLQSGGANILCLKQCGGGVIENIINGKIQIRTSYALSITNLHLETGSLEIYDTNCTIKDSIIFKRDEVIDTPIYLDDSNYSSITMGSKPITLDNVLFLQYYKLSDYKLDKHDIDITNFRGVVNLKNVNRRIANIGLVKTSTCGISLYTGNKILYNVYDETTIKNKKQLLCNDEAISTMSNFISSIVSDSGIKWVGTLGNYFYNACNVIDIDRKVGKVTTNTSQFNASINGACINIGYTETNGIIRLYRGNSTTNFTHYVDIPNPLGFIFDNGISCNGYVWQSLQNALVGADIQNIVTGLINNGGYVIGRSSSIPTLGRWWQGDVLINNTPSEQGIQGSKYIVNGWTCVTTGSPGVWVQNRVLTGN